MIHELKILPQYFDDVISGRKTFEVRKADRPYKVGDLLALNEYQLENGYTDRCCLVYVDYLLEDADYCKDGYIVMAIKPCLVGFAGSPRDMLKICEDYSVPEIKNTDERRFR